MRERVRTSLVMSTTRQLADAVKLDATESGARVILSRDSGWSRTNQRVRVRLGVKFKDGRTHEYVSGIRGGEEVIHRGVPRTESMFSVRFMRAGRDAQEPDDIVDEVSVTVEPVQGTPTIQARLETF